MCGIGAIVSRRSIPAAEMIAYCLKLSEGQRHRGPDDEGFVLVDSDGQIAMFSGSESAAACTYPDIRTAQGEYICAMVHRRLSIIAPGFGGHQPMVGSDAPYILSYNGEIFNFQELNVQNGFQSSTKTDSETLLQLFAKIGYRCLPQLDGFFAGLVWDNIQKKLSLFRDLTGVKPLFHTRKGDVWFFASETKPLREVTGFNSPDPVTVFHYLTEGVIGDKEHFTFYTAIHELKKGVAMEWTAKTGLDIAYEIKPENVTPVHLKEKLSDSIKRRLLSDVPLGFAVSGGLDSAAIIGLARQELGEDAQLKAFSIVSSDAESDESTWQKQIVDAYGAEWHTADLANSSATLMEDVIAAVDMPVVAWNNLAHYELCKLAKDNGVTVLFNGQGADEIFGGYPDYLQRDFWKLSNLYKKHPTQWPLSFDEIRKGWIKLKTLQYSPEIVKDYIFQKGFSNLVHPDFKGHPAYLWSLAGLTADQKMKEDYYGKKLGQMLLWEDRNGMANGLESRNPFADDNALATFLKIPFKKKIENGFTKGILRDALKGIVPDSVLWRVDKKGFTVPDSKLTWARKTQWEPLFMSSILDEWSPREGREALLKTIHMEDKRGLQWYFRLSALSVFLHNK